MKFSVLLSILFISNLTVPITARKSPEALKRELEGRAENGNIEPLPRGVRGKADTPEEESEGRELGHYYWDDDYFYHYCDYDYDDDYYYYYYECDWYDRNFHRYHGQYHHPTPAPHPTRHPTPHPTPAPHPTRHPTPHPTHHPTRHPTPPPSPCVESISVDKSCYHVGEGVHVTFTTCGTHDEFIGMYLEGTTPDSDDALNWFYVCEGCSLHPGTYTRTMNGHTEGSTRWPFKGGPLRVYFLNAGTGRPQSETFIFTEGSCNPHPPRHPSSHERWWWWWY